MIEIPGWLWAATIGAVVGFMLLNYYFTPPVHTWTIAGTENVLALVVFLLVAVTISATVERSLRHAEEAAAAVPIAEADRLRTALAMGADRGMHAALPDGAPTSRALASSRRADAQYAREVYVEVKRSIGSCAHGE